MTTATKRIPIPIIGQCQPNSSWSVDNSGIDYLGNSTSAYGFEGNKVLNMDKCFVRAGKIYSSFGFAQLYTGFTGVPSTQMLYQYNATSFRLMTGTNTRLYADNINITPLQTSTTAIANSIDTTNGLATIVVDAVAHGQAVGDRVKINGSTDVGGILAANINKEHIITAITTDTFTVNTGTNATSTVSNGGGGAITYQKQIAAGTAMGVIDARIWSMDTFGNLLILTPGNQTGVYKWDGDTAIAPTALTNAPTAVDYVFVHNNIICTLGAGGQRNRFKTCSRGNETLWDVTATGSTAYEDDIEGASRLISGISGDGFALVWSLNKCYRLDYKGTPDIWGEPETIMQADGIASPMARCSIENVIYWSGINNWYAYDGSAIIPLPTDDFMQQMASVPIRTYRFFVSLIPMPMLDQVWFMYSNAGTAISRVAIFNYKEAQFAFSRYEFSAGLNPYASTQTGVRGYFAHSSNGRVYQINATQLDSAAANNTLIYQTPFNAVGDGDFNMEIEGLELHTNRAFDSELTIKLITTDTYTPTTSSGNFTTTTYTGDDVVNNYLEVKKTARYRSWRFEYDLINGASQYDDVFISKLVEHVRKATER